MIKIATAECFTHGKIGNELHALGQSYEGKFGCEYIKNPEKYGEFNYNQISVPAAYLSPLLML